MSHEASYTCAMYPTDTLATCVLGDGVFLDVLCREHSADIKLTPTDARALAEWLLDAADEAEANIE
jgi:hypothetical protein